MYREKSLLSEIGINWIKSYEAYIISQHKTNKIAQAKLFILSYVMEAEEKMELSCCDNDLKWESLCKDGALLNIQFRLFVTVQRVRCTFFHNKNNNFLL